VSAETLRYRQAWLSLAVFFGASVFHALSYQASSGVPAASFDRRMAAEKERAHQTIMLCTSNGFVALLVVPRLDHRFDRTLIPLSTYPDC
jgi:hypothetical protein